MDDSRKNLEISERTLKDLNAFLLEPNNELINDILEIVGRYGGPDEINRKAQEAGRIENSIAKLKEIDSPYLKDLEWLVKARDKGAFISISDYNARILGHKGKPLRINADNAVTLEISALQYFPWLIAEARRALDKAQLMPGRFIRVRNMAEQCDDNGDVIAISAAMKMMGASYVETLDTKGTDGSNVHLGGPETITGYFGGVGQPNHYPLLWADEYLKYYTTYGIKQVLNINPGTVLLGYLLHKLGIDNEFKISVFMGNDNPFAIMWTLLTARLFSRENGSTPLIGFNLSNSANNQTIRKAAAIRKAFGLENVVRFEHHVTETWKSIVRQPYNRRAELVEIAKEVRNISAKHEGGEPEVEKNLKHPSDILDYFMSKKEIVAQKLMQPMENNYLQKHESVNLTAEALINAGIGVIGAPHLHHQR